MNNELFEKYRLEILKTFKQHFKNTFVKGPQITFESILNLTFNELQLTLTDNNQIHFLKDWFENIYHQKYLKEVFSKITDLNEIILHSNQNIQLILSNGTIQEEICFLDEIDYQLSLEVLCSKNNTSWNFTHPFVSIPLMFEKHHFRATFVHYSLTPNKQSKVFLRKHSEQNFQLNDFSKDHQLSQFLSELIMNKKNVLISGSTGSGKTSFLKSMMNFSDENEHIIILEDTHEINLPRIYCTNLISDDKTNSKSLKNYCQYAMRMSPDRIILGEMRGIEVIPFLLAMNTGHKGLISTIHANSAIDSIHRLNLLFSFYSDQSQMNPNYITKMICQNIEYIIHLDKREVVEVIKVLGSNENSPMVDLIYRKSA